MSTIDAVRKVERGWRVVGGALGVMMLLAGVARGEGKGEYVFWPEPPEVPRVQFLTSIGATAAETPKDGAGTDTQKTEAGNNAPKAGVDAELKFAVAPQRPYGLRMHEGTLYVCGGSGGTVTALDFKKKETRVLWQNEPVKPTTPIDIAVAADGMKYVTDTGTGEVLKYDALEHFAGRISAKDMRPVGVAVRGDELYVADLNACTVRVFERSDGKELRTIGEKGEGDGRFGGVYGLALDRGGNILANDILSARLTKFGADGRFLWGTGGMGSRPGQFVRPKLIAVDAADYVYAPDSAFHNVQVFDEKGTLVTVFGGQGEFPGAMNGPGGVCVSETDVALFAKYVHPAFEARRLIFVSNLTGPQKISVYAWGELKAGKTVADIAEGRVAVPANAGAAITPGR